jgi:hypothetical protein
MVKYHFITFATPDHMSFAEANVKSALEVGGFDTSKIYSINDIDEKYITQNINLFNRKRGYGYWNWKPYFILKRLLEIDENDILCYNDSKYLWLTNVRKIEKDILLDKNIGVYGNRPNSGSAIEKEWTKMDALVLMNIPANMFENILNTGQVWAGFNLLRKSFISIRFIGEWLTYVQDYRIVTDSPSIFGPENSSFREHRHDQSILSLLCKKWGILMHEMNKNDLIDIRNSL